MKQKYEIYFDMDETIYNLSKAVISEYNKDFNKDYDYKLNRSYWWQDTGAPISYFSKVLRRPGVFNSQPAKEEDIYYLKKLYDECYEINISTAPIWESNCMVEKIEWLKKYFPFINIDKNVFFGGDKHKLSKANRILVDDNDTYLIPWEKNGGISMAYGNKGWSKYNKNRCHSMEEFYNFVKKLK